MPVATRFPSHVRQPQAPKLDPTSFTPLPRSLPARPLRRAFEDQSGSEYPNLFVDCQRETSGGVSSFHTFVSDAFSKVTHSLTD